MFLFFVILKANTCIQRHAYKLQNNQSLLPLFVLIKETTKGQNHRNKFSPPFCQKQKDQEGVIQNKYDTNSRYDNKVHIDTK